MHLSNSLAVVCCLGLGFGLLSGCADDGVSAADDEVGESGSESESESGSESDSDSGSEPDPLAGVVFINEVLVAPGAQHDWIELVNVGGETVDLRGLRLRAIPLDDPGEVHEHLVSDDAAGSIEAGGFWTLEADSGPQEPGVCASVFQVPDGPVDLHLYGPSGGVIDHVVLDEELLEGTRPGISLGRFPDGGAEIIGQSQPTPSASNPGPPAHDACLDGPGPDSFDDHTYPCLGSSDSFYWLAGSRASTTAVKFLLSPYADAENLPIAFLDTVFYSVHDEWYYFRMLNGQSVANEDLYAPYDGDFGSVEEIYAWAQGVDVLPYDEAFLKWSGDRLLSTRFYDLAIDIQPRILGAGTLIHVPARDEPEPRPEIWGFELEYRDEPAHADVAFYFESLEASLPADISASLNWIVRSPAQEELAVAMEAGELERHDQIIRYSELSVPGEVEVYHGGLIAGRVRVVEAGESGLEDATSTDILVLEEIPDYLPPCIALVTAVPQTPLAHINLLAKSRGIPNLYIGDVVNDPEWDQWGRQRARVILRATEFGGYEAVGMTKADYDLWRDLQLDDLHILPSVDLQSAPYSLDLGAQSVDDMVALRPLIGGKAAGFLALLEVFGDDPQTTTPDAPLAITVRAYNEHIAPFRVLWLDAILDMVEFRYLKYRKDRYLILEGELAYDLRYPSDLGQLFRETFLSSHPEGDWLGDLVRSGGVRKVIADTPIDPATLAQIRAALDGQFGDLATTQGLRFRSSSNVEDIEGFNGAGLYNSNTGYLHADALADPEDQAKTIEAAILQTWTSYWSWEAYEERLTADIEHISGNMGVLVHPRFDDDFERANGVFTMTRFPSAVPAHAPDQFPGRYELVINGQIGALSVTNPPPGVCSLPEVIRLRAEAGGEPGIERLQGSSELEAGVEVISDATALLLFERAREATDLWLGLENGVLPSDQAYRTVTLDYEFRDMDAGWPALAGGDPYPGRMIVKQVRSLDPSTSAVPEQVVDLPVPRDVLSRARLVTRRVCEGDRLTLTVVEVATDPLAAPDLGYALTPFTAEVVLEASADVPELGWVSGHEVRVTHLELGWFDHPGVNMGGDWLLEADVAEDAQAELGLATLVWTPGGSWSVVNEDGEAAEGTAFVCAVETLHATPDNFLLDLLADG